VINDNQQVLRKLKLAVCFKLAASIPDDIDPKIMLAWAKNGPELREQISGKLDFLKKMPEITGGDDLIRSETATVKIFPRRNAPSLLMELNHKRILLDPFYNVSSLTNLIKTADLPPTDSTITAVCFDREMTTSKALFEMSKLGLRAATLSHLTAIALDARDFLSKLGTVVNPFVVLEQTINTFRAPQLMDYHGRPALGHHNAQDLLPENTWFIGINPKTA
jgi:hypothetical protein